MISNESKYDFITFKLLKFYGISRTPCNSLRLGTEHKMCKVNVQIAVKMVEN